MTASKLHTYTEVLPSGFSFDMRYIPGGTFDMGSTEDDLAAYKYEMPQRISVSVAPVYIGVFPVTQAFWKAMMGEENNPSNFIGDNSPVEQVSWLEVKEFIMLLNSQTSEKRTQIGMDEYRLPTEAEWEFAARGAELNARYKFAGSDKLKEVGWFKDNSGSETHEVGRWLPNALGLFDMSGNVYEWMEDHWHPNYENAPKDSRAWLKADESAPRVLRGGGCFSVIRSCRVAYSNGRAPGHRNAGIGFRLALSPCLGQSITAIL